MAPQNSPKKPSGKGKILGMPYWAAGLALVLGAVVGYILLKHQPASADAGAGTGGSGTAPPASQDAGAGGGLSLADLAASLGAPIHGAVSTGATNSTGAPSGGDSFAPADNAPIYPALTAGQKQQIISQSGGGSAPSQPALTGAQIQQIANTTPAATTPASSMTYHSHNLLAFRD